MYEIILSNKPLEDVELSVYVDAVKPLMIPGSVAISVGNKEKMYKNWMTNTLFDSNNKQVLLNFLVHLHDKGIEMKKMNLICRCKFDKFHSKVIKEVLEENKDTLTSLISYLVPNSANKSMLAEMEANAPKANSSNMTLDDLPASDAAQIRALIQADMKKTRLEADASSDEVPVLVDVVEE
jgi:hypothetical protein